MLTLRDVHFAYTRGRPVLDGITTAIQPGITGVIGPNAAGKSTLLRLLAGLLEPTSGTIAFDSRPITELTPIDRARRIAYLPQRPLLSAPFRVREVVELGRYAMPPSPDAVSEAMARADVESLANRPFLELSVGQQQRVALARTLAQLSPLGSGKFLLADEPIAAMDPEHVLATCQTLRWVAGQGVSVVVVLHDLTIAARLAERILMLDATGRLAADAPAREALTPEQLQSTFHVRFAETSTDAGRVLVADALDRDTSGIPPSPSAGV